jgi:hypothetical protein
MAPPHDAEAPVGCFGELLHDTQMELSLPCPIVQAAAPLLKLGEASAQRPIPPRPIGKNERRISRGSDPWDN